MKTLFPAILLTHILFYTACAERLPNYIDSPINIQETNMIETQTIDTEIIDNQMIDYNNPSPIVSTEVYSEPTYSEPTYSEPIYSEPTYSEPTHSEPTHSESGITHQLATMQGKTITITENGNSGFIFPQYAGKIIIFDIIGKDCEYCKEEIPIINRIKAEFPSSIEIISIQAQGRMRPSDASNMLNQYNINNPIIEGDDAKELLRFIADTYGWTGILPYVLLVKNGATEYTFPDGGVSYKELRESIENLL